MKRGFFITGTDTGVGKTLAAETILAILNDRGYRTAAMKPVACGCATTPSGLRNEDALRLMQQCSVEVSYARVNTYPLQRSIAPNLAAAEQGIDIELDRVIEQYHTIASQTDYVVIEGVGGWMVPINGHETMADLAYAIHLPLIMVVGVRLGCLNHALLTSMAILTRSWPRVVWIANCLDTDTAVVSGIIDTLKERLPFPLVGILPRLPLAKARYAAPCIDIPALLDD